MRGCVRRRREFCAVGLLDHLNAFVQRARGGDGMKRVRTKLTISPNLPAASSKVQLRYPLRLYKLCHTHNLDRGLRGNKVSS